MARPAATVAARSALEGITVDLAATALDSRRKRLLLADMDATIIHQESLDELAAVAGVGARVADVTARAMAGEIDFATSVRERVGLLAGQPATLLTETQKRLSLRPGARELVATMRADGAVTALVSGGFTVFARQIAAAAGFDHYEANELEIIDELLTGKVAEPVLGGPHKEATLRRLATENDIALSETIVVGDGANDRFAIAAAGLGVALHGKAVLKAAADVSIEHADLTSLLYIQGYRQAEFVT